MVKLREEGAAPEMSSLVDELRSLMLDVLWLRRERPRQRTELRRMVYRLFTIGRRLEGALRSAGDHAGADEVQRIYRLEAVAPAGLKA